MFAKKLSIFALFGLLIMILMSCGESKKSPQIQLPGWYKINHGTLTLLGMYVNVDGYLVDPNDRSTVQGALVKDKRGFPIMTDAISYSGQTIRYISDAQLQLDLKNALKQVPTCQKGGKVTNIYRKKQNGQNIFVVSGYCVW